MAWTTAVTRATSYGVTAAVWNAEHVDNMNFLKEVAYTEFTATVSVTGTSDVQIVSAGAITFEAVPHWIEFGCSAIQVGGSSTLAIKLRDSTTLVDTFETLAASEINRFVCMRRRITPTAASHTYNFAAANGASQTSSVFAAAAGTSVRMPGFIRITRVPT